MRTDFIFDFETLSKNAVTAPIVECAAHFFSWERFLDKPYSLFEIVDEVKHFKLDIQDQIKNYGRKTEESTMKFWMGLPKEVRESVLLPRKDDLKLKEFTEEFITYLHAGPKVSYWWSRSNTFDPIILLQAGTATDTMNLIDQYLKFWKVRDIRTFIDAKLEFGTKNGFCPVADESWWKDNFVAHDSRFDVAADILRLQAIHRAENGLEQTSQ